MLLSASCQTTQTEAPPTEPPEPQVELTFPDFPAPGDAVTLDEEANTVTMPLDYWLSITDYVIDVRETEEKYKAIHGE